MSRIAEDGKQRGSEVDEVSQTLRHRPSMQHVLRWLSYHARPTHHRPPPGSPAASLHRGRKLEKT